MIGDHLENRVLLEMQAYIARLSQNLEFLCRAAGESLHSEKLRRTVRAMAVWGPYPWRSFDHSLKPLNSFGLIKLSLALPFHLFQGLGYLALKYFQYLPYRNFRRVDYSKKSLGVFSPSLHLLEFSDRSYTGFWGEVKFLSEEMSLKTAWFLVPFKAAGTSNRQLVHQIRQINHESQFRLIPLASFLSMQILAEAIIDLISFHAFLAKLIFYEATKKSDIKVCRIFVQEQLGLGIARTELNRHLLGAGIARGTQLKSILHLMEGQSWEIALNDLSLGLGLPCWGVIHTPLRAQDSQILNYLLKCNERSLAELKKNICCPGRSSLETLTGLGVPQSQLQVVESQRFIHFQVLKKFTYSSVSRKVLYVSDANIKTTEHFAKLIGDKSGHRNKSNLEFFLQPHPSQSHIEFSGLPLVNRLEAHDFGVIIFGPETSSYLQPEFNECNIRFFNPPMPPQRFLQMKYLGIPQVENLEDIEISLENSFKLNKDDDLLILRDDSFTKWRKVIDELFKP